MPILPIPYNPPFDLTEDQARLVMWYMEHQYRMEDIANLLESNIEFQKVAAKLTQEEQLKVISDIADKCDEYISNDDSWYCFAEMAIKDAGFKKGGLYSVKS